MSNLKILRVSFIEKTMADHFYEENPEVEGLPYVEQQLAILSSGFTYSDSFSRAMMDLGNQAEEVILNMIQLQRSWAREHGLKTDPADEEEQILLAQIAAYKPDVLYFQAANCFRKKLGAAIRERFPSLFVAGYTAIQFDPAVTIEANLFLAGTPCVAADLARHGITAPVIYHAFDDRILDHLGDKEKSPDIDFSFVGSSGFGHYGTHATRYWMLADLLLRTNIELWTLEHQDKAVSAENKKDLEWMGDLLRQAIEKLPPADAITEYKRHLFTALPVESAGKVHMFPGPLGDFFSDRINPPVTGIDMFRILKRSRVTFNIHTDLMHHRQTDQWESCNMRMFEATGAGTCLLVNDGVNIRDLFEPDEEVVTFSSLEDCVEKVEYLLGHEDKRHAIADAGHRRVLRDHTIAKRCALIDEILQERIRR